MAVRVWGGGAAPAWPHAHVTRAVREDAAPGSPLGAPLQASSPLRRRLIYTLHDGAADLFEIHFDTGETSRPPLPAPRPPARSSRTNVSILSRSARPREWSV